MRSLIFNCILLCLLCLPLAGVSGQEASTSEASTESEAPARLRTMRSPHFEVIGLDMRSVAYMDELGSMCVQVAERYLPSERLASPRPILVSLRPEEFSEFAGDYRIRVAGQGIVQLELRWEASLSLERACSAMSEALLIQYAIYNYGLEAPQHMRAWPVSALGAELLFALRPAKFVDVLKQARQGSAAALTPLLELLLADATQADRERSAHLDYSGYWLLQAMKTSALTREGLRDIFQQAVAGVDVEDALLGAVVGNEPGVDAVPGQEWFGGQMQALLSREYEVMESMGETRAWLAALVSFEGLKDLDIDGLAELESKAGVLNLRSLWKHREEPAVRELVQARYEILRLRMLRLNSAYFNAARSLGVLFETILSDGASHQYLHALTIYLSDWEDAKDMQDKIELILE